MDVEFLSIIGDALQKLSYDNIRPYQKEVVENYLLNKDVFFCAPTGSGKSLVFEIAPFVIKEMNKLKKCTAIVVSPLVSLMRSQASNLQKKNIKAVYLKDLSETSLEDIFTSLSIDDVRKGDIDILFASPESLLDIQRELIMEMASKGYIKALFIDEAHCIQKFGKPDVKRKTAAYRPCYGRLCELRSLVGKNVPVIAMTATATEEVKSVILKDLCMHNYHEVILNPNKENMKYWVVKVENDDTAENFQWLVDLLYKQGINTPRMLIFFRQIKHIVDVYEHLETELGKSAYIDYKEEGPNDDRNRLFDMYHLKTDDDVKNSICSSYHEPGGNIRVVLCSTSFSMGLDVKGVDIVIHYGPSNDSSDYIQETGRAGRDPATMCHAVLMKYKRCGSKNVSKDMKDYVKTTECRRKLLMDHLGQTCGTKNPIHLCCDNCQSKCKCVCKCENNCECTEVCNVEIIDIIKQIQDCQINAETGSTSSSLSDESDIELPNRKPRVLYSSDDDPE